MIDPHGGAAKRAQRLLRWYPPAWRARYGDEFTQLLIDDIVERPRSLTRTADVFRSGLLARLAGAGLVGDTRKPEHQIRAGLATLSIALSAFLAFGIAIWSQLTIGWQWAAPATPATRTGMILMWGAAIAVMLLVALAAIPILWVLGRAFVSGRARGLMLPAIAISAGLVFVIAGSVHFGHGWPGTGGHPWDGRDIVPDSVARFAWAATLWVNAYWVHPGALGSFPASEIAWMSVSPIALLAVLVGAGTTLRRLPLPAPVLRYESWLGMATVLAMAAFLAGAASWVISGGPGPRDLFRVGAIHWVCIVLMSATLLLAFRAAQRALGTRIDRDRVH
jgi:hypothetical protein